MRAKWRLERPINQSNKRVEGGRVAGQARHARLAPGGVLHNCLPSGPLLQATGYKQYKELNNNKSSATLMSSLCSIICKTLSSVISLNKYFLKPAGDCISYNLNKLYLLTEEHCQVKEITKS